MISCNVSRFAMTKLMIGTERLKGQLMNVENSRLIVREVQARPEPRMGCSWLSFEPPKTRTAVSGQVFYQGREGQKQV
jgi:hypothetical protein